MNVFHGCSCLGFRSRKPKPRFRWRFFFSWCRRKRSFNWVMYDDLGGEVLYMFFSHLMAYFEYCTLVYIYIYNYTLIIIYGCIHDYHHANTWIVWDDDSLWQTADRDIISQLSFGFLFENLRIELFRTFGWSLTHDWLHIPACKDGTFGWRGARICCLAIRCHPMPSVKVVGSEDLFCRSTWILQCRVVLNMKAYLAMEHVPMYQVKRQVFFAVVGSSTCI